MLERWGKNDEKILDESISAIQTETARMSHLVEQLLFLARGDSGKTRLTMEEVNLAGGVKQNKNARLVEMGAHLALQHFAHVLVGVAAVPVVDDAFGRVGTVLKFQTDETSEFVEVVDDGGLFAGDNLLVVLVGTLHFGKELHLVGCQ